jgi:hypothetical protein
MQANLSSFVSVHQQKVVALYSCLEKTHEGWVCLDINEASRREIYTQCCELLQGSDSQWLSGYSHNKLGQCSAYIAKLWECWKSSIVC